MKSQQTPVKSSNTHKRKANWRNESSLLILELVTVHRRIREGKQFSENTTARQWAEVWGKTTSKINPAFPEVMIHVVEVKKK